MAYEDFTTYTEFDEGSDITVDSATKVSWLEFHAREETGYLYKDKGVDHFSGDFTHKFEMQFDIYGGFLQVAHWMLANLVGDYQYLRDNNGDSQLVYYYNPTNYKTIRLYVLEEGVGRLDEWVDGVIDTLYYIEVVRDDDGGSNNTGRLTAYIRTGSHTGALQDTLVLDAAAGEQNDFRYIYALAGRDDDGQTYYTGGFTQNLDIGEGAAPITGDLNATIPIITADFKGGGALNVTLPIITAKIFDDGVFGELNATLPVITADLKSGGTLDATLPIITAKLGSLNEGNLDATLPIVTAEITGLAGELGGISTTLPLITADMLGGNGAFLDATLPAITAEMKSGAQLDAELPMITAECHGYAGVVGDMSVTLPGIEAEVTGKVEVLGDLDVTLPIITARMKGLVGKVISLNTTLPMITAGLTGYQEITGDLNVTLPMVEARITGAIARESCEILRFSEPEL